MVAATGLTADQFEDRWLAEMGRRYRTLRIASIVTAMISATMAVLAVAAFVVRRRQMREAARRWEEEEFDQRMRRLLGDDYHR